VYQHLIVVQANTQCGGPNFQLLLQSMAYLKSSRKSQVQICPRVVIFTIERSTEGGRSQIQVKRQNDLAMSCFTMAFMKEGIMRLVRKAKTNEWPDGLAYFVVRELNKKYKPRDILSCV
jgi:hypothetical protein